jgi:hypothetical protein
MPDERDDDQAFLDKLIERLLFAGVNAPTRRSIRDGVAARLAEAEGLRETLRRLKRTGELSAAIMRDTRRTGAWEGAERTARAFERMGEFADRALKGAPDAG